MIICKRREYPAACSGDERRIKVNIPCREDTPQQAAGSFISIIVAVGKNRVIGKNNALPWKLPADMERFRRLTMGKPVIIGQKTFESIGKALPGRTNIVLTLDKNFQAVDCLITHSIEEALQIAKEKSAKEIMVIGGASVYKQFFPLADRLYLTLIEGDFEGDAFFPEIDYNEWRETEKIGYQPDKDNPYTFTFVTLERIPHD